MPAGGYRRTARTHGTSQRVCPTCSKSVPANKENGTLKRHKDRDGVKCMGGRT